MTSGGTVAGLFFVTAGVWLVDSAVQNRPPIKTLYSVVKSPATAFAAVRKSNGTAYALPTHSTGTANTTSTGFDNGPTASNTQAAAAISFARAQIGKPYKWGAAGPNAFDCSGLVQAAYKSAGITLPRTTAGMVLVGSPVSKKNLQPGDLVFPDLHHVQIYTGNGKVVEAPRTGLKVREVSMWGFVTARRIVYRTETTV